jgi:hypothetical protein
VLVCYIPERSIVTEPTKTAVSGEEGYEEKGMSKVYGVGGVEGRSTARETMDAAEVISAVS